MPDTPTSLTPTDAQLVAGHVAGDRSALAAIYDRYSDSLYDTAAAMLHNRHDAADVMQDVFVVAAERLGQLRDADRLKPWLFAILRNEVYRRSGNKKRTVATDFTDSVAEMNLPSEPPVEATDAEYEELAALVRGAAAGLDERDQLVLEYSLRQGLDGDDLADALGVTPQQCYGLVHRMRQRTERSLGAFCVARTGRKDCAELAGLLGAWDGQFSVLVRKRVARHVEQCDTCERSRRKLAPFAMLGAAPAFAAPAGLRQRVLAATDGGPMTPAYGFGAPGGFPTVIKYARRVAVWLMLTVLALLIVGGATVIVLLNDDDPDRASAAAETTTTTGRATTTTEVVSTTTSAATTSVPARGLLPPATTTTSSSTTTTSSAPPATPTSSPVNVAVPRTTTTQPITIATSSSSTTTTSPTTSTTTTSTATTTTSTTTSTTTTTTTTVPGALSISAGSFDFGTSASSVVVTLSNVGGGPVGWSTSTGPRAFRGTTSPFSASPAGGTLQGGESVEVTVSYDRNWPVEGPTDAATLTFVGPGTFVGIDLDGVIARPPVITNANGFLACFAGPPPATSISVLATITDETAPLTAELTLLDPIGVTYGPVGTAVKGDEHSALIDIDPDGDAVVEGGDWTWTLTATDGFGNIGTASGVTTVPPSQPCP